VSFDRPTKKLLVIVCDACGESMEIPNETNDWRETWRYALDEGWRIRNGEHHCSECAELD
jgi:hypothetical protein